jgi:hypothetical protein
MNITRLRATLALLLAGALASPVTFANGRKHAPRSPARATALQQCRLTYEAAAAAAHTPNGPKGHARKRAMHAAAEAKKGCVAQAPR